MPTCRPVSRPITRKSAEQGATARPAEAVMLYGLGDIRMRRQFIEDEDAGEDRKRREHKRLDALLGYCEAPTCRRVTLLAYFGEQARPCGNCDACLDPTGRVDGTDAAKAILATIQRSGERFGAAHIIDILCGTTTDKIVRAGHDRLPTFGTGTTRKKNEWRSLVRQMVATGLLQLDIAGYGGARTRDNRPSPVAGRWRVLSTGTKPRASTPVRPEHPVRHPTAIPSMRSNRFCSIN